jgi:DNA-binding beta-propeller fold protein YncE
MPLIVQCECGKQLRVKEELAGKRIRCPECQGVVAVPAEDIAPAPPEPRPRRPRAAATPTAEPPRRVRADEDDDTEDAPAPRRRSRETARSSSNMLLWLVLGGGALLVLAVLAAVGVSWLFLRPTADKPGAGGSGGAGNKDGAKGATGQPKTIAAKASIKCQIEGGATAVSASADGKLVIVQGYGNKGNVQIWDVQKQQRLHAFDNQSGSVLPVAIAPDGKTAAYSEYGSIVVVDVGSGKVLRALGPPPNQPFGFNRGLQFSPDGELVVVASESLLVGWDWNTGAHRFAWKADDKEVTGLSRFFDGGKKIASGGKTGTVKIWEIPSGKLLQTLSGEHKEQVLSVAVTENGKTLASAEIFGTIKVWDTTAGKVTKVFPQQEVPIRVEHMLFLPDGKTLLYEDRNHNIVLHDVQGDAQRGLLQGHTKTVWSLALTQSGSTLVSGSEDDTIKIWDLKAVP